MGLDYRFQIVHPSPVPSVWLLLPVGLVENLSKILTRSSSGTPTPWSLMDTVTGVGISFKPGKTNRNGHSLHLFQFFFLTGRVFCIY